MRRKRTTKTVYWCPGCAKYINFPQVVDIDGVLTPHCPECEIEVKTYKKITK